jgi:myo-inositol-1-phosphate synthase
VSKIKIAVVGLGNCASALLRGFEYYKNVDETSCEERKAGLSRVRIGEYLIRDIKVVAAFDVNVNKVGRDIAEAIRVYPNNDAQFADVPMMGVKVSQGFLGDGVNPGMRHLIPVDENAPYDVVKVLRESGATILLCYLPVASYKAARYYAQCCLEAGVAFINCMPEFIASEPEWFEKFAEAGLPCAGDDVQSQFGATFYNRVMLWLLIMRGFVPLFSTQFNDGGNADFFRMSFKELLTSKRISKESPLKWTAPGCEILASPAEYKEELKDTKIASITIEGTQFGGVPFEIFTKLKVEDSANSAGVIVNAIRLMKLSLDRGLTGYQEWSPYCFKHPFEHKHVDDAERIVEEFIG